MLLAVLANLPPSAALGDQGAQSQLPPTELTLEDSIKLALENSRTLINARLGRVVEKLALEAAEDQFRPRVTIGPSLNVISEGSEDGRSNVTNTGVTSSITVNIPTGGTATFTANADRSSAGQTPYGTSLTFKFSQPLLRGGGLVVGTADLENARRQEEIYLLAFRAVVSGLVTQVINEYVSLVQATRQLDIRVRSLQRARELLAVNQLLIGAGRMAEREIVQTEADIAARELALTGARNNLEAARLALVSTLDIDIGTRIVPAELPAIDPVSLDVERGLELALEHRPDYRQALLRLDNLRTNLLVAKDNRRWNLSLDATATFGEGGRSFSDSLGGIDDGDYRLGLTLAIPLGDRAPERAYLSARTGLTQARNNLDELRQTIDIGVRNSVRGVEVAFRQIELARRARELTRQQLDIEREKLNLGLSTNFQLVAFEDNLVNAQNLEVDASISYFNALTGLDQTLGTTLETYGLDVDWTEP